METKKINSKTVNKPKSIKDSNYKRPELTYTDKLTKEQVESLLIDYEQVENIEKVPIGSHIRYFEDKDGEMKFRTGGIITIIKSPDYIILNNGKLSWSVQIKKCLFFRRLTIKEVKREYDEILVKKDKEINELIVFIKNLQKDVTKLKQINNKLKQQK